MADIGNIEFCLDFWIKFANNNINKKPTGISIFQSENSGSKVKVKDAKNPQSMQSKEQEVDGENSFESRDSFHTSESESKSESDNSEKTYQTLIKSEHLKLQVNKSYNESSDGG